MPIVNTQNDPFVLERLRNALSSQGDILKFRALYTSEFVEIPDLNTSEFWNKKVRDDICGFSKDIFTKRKINLIADFLKTKDGKLLDIGFGSADLERILAISNKRLDLYGIDISDLAIKTVREFIRSGDFRIGSIFRIPHEGSFFDFVSTLDVLEHIPPSKALVAYGEVYRVLKRKGIFIISVPLNETLEKMIKEGVNPNAHVRVYTPDILKMELKIMGFKILKEIYLYAFKNFYSIKNFLIKFFPKDFRKPNLLIVIAKKV